MVSGQQLKFKQASAKVRAEGVKPFTKAFGTRMKQILGKARRKSSKKSGPKRRKSSTKKRSTSKRSSTTKRSTGSTMTAKKGGTKGMTRVKKVLLGLGIGTAFSLIAAVTRVREVEGVAPIIDAAVGGGVEAQIGTAIPRLIRQVIMRTGGGNPNGFSNLSLQGA